LTGRSTISGGGGVQARGGRARRRRCGLAVRAPPPSLTARGRGPRARWHRQRWIVPVYDMVENPNEGPPRRAPPPPPPRRDIVLQWQANAVVGRDPVVALGVEEGGPCEVVVGIPLRVVALFRRKRRLVVVVDYLPLGAPDRSGRHRHRSGANYPSRWTTHVRRNRYCAS
jgi:hypothetical protein